MSPETLKEIRGFLETSKRDVNTAALVRTGLELLAEVDRLRGVVKAAAVKAESDAGLCGPRHGGDELEALAETLNAALR